MNPPGAIVPGYPYLDEFKSGHVIVVGEDWTYQLAESGFESLDGT